MRPSLWTTCASTSEPLTPRRWYAIGHILHVLTFRLPSPRKSPSSLEQINPQHSKFRKAGEILSTSGELRGILSPFGWAVIGPSSTVEDARPASYGNSAVLNVCRLNHPVNELVNVIIGQDLYEKEARPAESQSLLATTGSSYGLAIRRNEIAIPSQEAVPKPANYHRQASSNRFARRRDLSKSSFFPRRRFQSPPEFCSPGDKCRNWRSTQGAFKFTTATSAACRKPPDITERLSDKPHQRFIV